MPDDLSHVQLAIPGLAAATVIPGPQVCADLAEAEARIETMERLYVEDGRHDPSHPRRHTYSGLKQQAGTEPTPASPEPAALATPVDAMNLRQCARARGLEYGAEAVALRREITRLEALEAACRARYYRELDAAAPGEAGSSAFAAFASRA